MFLTTEGGAMKIIAAPLHLFLIACTLLALLQGCVRVQGPTGSQSSVSLSEVTTASSVSPDGQPLAVSSIFSATTPAIYVTAKLNNAPKNTTVGVRWVYVQDDSGRQVNQQIKEDSTAASGTRYVSFSIQPSAGAWGSGQYSAALLMNGNEVTSARFTVQSTTKSTAQAPTISYFKAVPEAISTGQAVTLSWSVTDATRVDISTIGTVAPSGNAIVTPVIGVEYQLTATNNAGSTSMKVRIAVTSFNSDKPELVITDFRVEGDKAYYKIKNIGGVNAKQSTTFLFVEGNQRASSMVDGLAAGEEREQYFPNFAWTYGSARSFRVPVRVCADALNVIGEYDENNNCLAIDW
jgi:hypothetical protein